MWSGTRKPKRKPDFFDTRPKPDLTFRYFCTENPETRGENPTYFILDPNPTFAPDYITTMALNRTTVWVKCISSNSQDHPFHRGNFKRNSQMDHLFTNTQCGFHFKEFHKQLQEGNGKKINPIEINCVSKHFQKYFKNFTNSKSFNLSNSIFWASPGLLY